MLLYKRAKPEVSRYSHDVIATSTVVDVVNSPNH